LGFWALLLPSVCCVTCCVPDGSFGLPFKDDIAALLYAYFFLWTPIYARFRGFSEGCKKNIIYFNLGNPSSPRLLFTPVSWHCHPLHMTTSASTPTLISSVPELQAFLSSIPPSSTLFLDLEGISLSRHGTISLITILIHPQRVVRLIDVLALGKLAFTTASNDGNTLKAIFEDPDISKCLWDVRNDADALWALYHVGLAGVTDIQLLENASSTGDKTYVRGLDKSV
jgi:hypothetical protein